jgi:hypothetical protein
VAFAGEIGRAGPQRHLRAALEPRQGLTPRFPDGPALASIEIRWPSAPGAGDAFPVRC